MREREPRIRPEFQGLRVPSLDLVLAAEWLLSRLKELDARRKLTPKERRQRAVDLDRTVREFRKTFFSLADRHSLILLPPEEAS